MIKTDRRVNMSVSDESIILSNASKEEIAREIKEIFSYVKVSKYEFDVISTDIEYYSQFKSINPCGFS